MRRYGVLVLTLFLLLPNAADASVLINEVAWMGTDEGGASCEWIELKNESSDTLSLVGWSLVIANAGSSAPKSLDLGDAKSVKYSGIAGGGFYLVARDSGSCKDLSPATSADWLGSFGTGISNTGAKITLYNGTSEEDSVDASTGWSQSGVGGKNTSEQSKETPQRTGLGWLTATPTPRSPNALPREEELPDEEEEVSATTTPAVVTVGGSVPLVPLAHPEVDLRISAIPSRIVSAKAHTPYFAVVYDSHGKLRHDAEVHWSFGDGGSEEGMRVTYAYPEVGEYLAVARASVKGGTAAAMFTVAASAAQVSIHEVSFAGIALINESGRIVDLSSWRLHSGRRTFVIPEDTLIAPGRPTLFAWKTTRLSASSTPELQYPDGTPVEVAEESR